VSALSPDVPWHVTRFHPDYQVANVEPTPVETMRLAVDIGRGAGIRYVYAGNILLPDAKDTACPACGAVVVLRDGLGRTECGLKDGGCPRCGTSLPIVMN
jgi:pyruvate formate lyase activating enzyme